MAEVDVNIVSLGVLGADMLNLKNVGLASQDFDNGLWRDDSDEAVAEDTHVADSNTLDRDTVGHKGDVLPWHVAPLYKTVCRDFGRTHCGKVRVVCSKARS